MAHRGSPYASPSYPSNSRGVRGGKRGGRGRGSSLNGSFQSVAFNYDDITPATPSTSIPTTPFIPKERPVAPRQGGYTFRDETLSSAPGTPSGSSTPHLGLGAKQQAALDSLLKEGSRNQNSSPFGKVKGGIGAGRGGGKGGFDSPLRGRGSNSYGAVSGSFRPINFVKAGTLFQEGEVTEVKIENDNVIELGSQAFTQIPTAEEKSDSCSLLPASTEFTTSARQIPYSAPSSSQQDIHNHETDMDLVEAALDLMAVAPGSATSVEVLTATVETTSIEVPNTTQMETGIQQCEEVIPTPLFYIDEEGEVPVTDGQDVNMSSPIKIPAAVPSAILGEDDDDDEEIVFIPKVQATPSASVPPSPPASTLVPIAPAAAPVLSAAAKKISTLINSDSFIAVPATATAPVIHPSTNQKLSKKAGKRAKQLRRRQNATLKENEIREAMDEDEGDIDWGSSGPPPPKIKKNHDIKEAIKNQVFRTRKQIEEDEILADYILNTGRKDSDDEDDGDDDEDQEVLQSFIRAALGGNQQGEETVTDHRLSVLQRQEDDSDSDDASGSDEGGDGWVTDEDEDGSMDIEVEVDESMMIGEGVSDEEDESEDEEDESEDEKYTYSEDEDESEDEEMNGDLAAAVRRSLQDARQLTTGFNNQTHIINKNNKKKKKHRNGKGRMMDEQDSGEEDGGLFQGRNTWADEDEDFIQAMMDDHLGVIQGKDRASRKKLFSRLKDVANGDYDAFGDFSDEDDFAVAIPVSKKNKNKHVPPILQDQWEKDRQKKAEFKRQRELEKLEAAQNLYKSTHNKKKKKNSKSKSFVEDSDDEFMPFQDKKKKAGMTNLMDLNHEIKKFLLDLGKTSMSLPPMEKESRRRVHLIADCYTLKSKSEGKGRARFTILYKTSRSGMNVNQSKLNHILKVSNARNGQDFMEASWSRKQDGNYTMPGRYGSSALTSQNTRKRDGDVVGEGAAKIGEDNLGHKLLSKMGWTEGTKIGKGDGGLSVPIVAIVKNTKSGLGTK